MRRIVAAAGMLIGSAGMVMAADLSRPVPFAPAPVRMIHNWTGFYLGGNLGGGWSRSETDLSSSGGSVFATADNNLTGVLGGAQIGYNRQSGPAVFGLEADFQASAMRGTLNAPTCPASVCGVALSASYTQKMPWFGTARARVGYAADTWLIYATGGYAYARMNSDAVATAGATSASFSQHDSRSGWALGAGIEVAFTPQWSAKLEYLYLDFGDLRTSLQFSGLPTINDDSRLTTNLVRAGVNYKF